MNANQANQLIAQHLDNVGVSLRRAKPFTPNDFPAVRRIEQEIRDLPIEHGYGFDSTGMPISHDIGTVSQVNPINFHKAWRDINDPYAENDYPENIFDAPVSIFTHNHPNSGSLSAGDLRSATQTRMPIRAVASEGFTRKSNGGVVSEFNPGSTRKSDLDAAIEKNQFVIAQAQGNIHISPQQIVDDIALSTKGYGELPSHVIHPMEPYAAAAANFPTMASDSFAIGRRTAPAPVVNAATQTAVDPNAWLSDRNATVNKVYRQAQTDENLQYELDYRQAMGDRYSHYGY